LIEAGDRHIAIGRDVLPAVGKRAGDVGGAGECRLLALNGPANCIRRRPLLRPKRKRPEPTATSDF
jgi:hypothetical protein